MDFLFEAHESEAHALHLFVGQRASFHTPYGLSFEKLSQELDEREYQVREPMFDALRVDIHPLGQDATKSLHFASKFGKFCVEVAG
jgi:hypothetical protein